MRTGGRIGGLLCAGLLGLGLVPARGDVLQLHSGGRLAGEVQGDVRPKQPGSAATVSVKTLSGATVTVAGEAID
ncbi:MAG: hypothetical protein ACK5EA_20095 [Planctomycetaceae bacterium]